MEALKASYWKTEQKYAASWCCPTLRQRSHLSTCLTRYTALTELLLSVAYSSSYSASLQPIISYTVLLKRCLHYNIHVHVCTPSGMTYMFAVACATYGCSSYMPHYHCGHALFFSWLRWRTKCQCHWSRHSLAITGTGMIYSEF